MKECLLPNTRSVGSIISSFKKIYNKKKKIHVFFSGKKKNNKIPHIINTSLKTTIGYSDMLNLIVGFCTL